MKVSGQLYSSSLFTPWDYHWIRDWMSSRAKSLYCCQGSNLTKSFRMSPTDWAIPVSKTVSNSGIVFRAVIHRHFGTEPRCLLVIILASYSPDSRLFPWWYVSWFYLVYADTHCLKVFHDLFLPHYCLFSLFLIQLNNIIANQYSLQHEVTVSQNMTREFVLNWDEPGRFSHRSVFTLYRGFFHPG
jgi:hypothetical protein